MPNTFRTLLVIGDNHEEIAKLYSLDTMVKPYLRYKFDNKSKYHISVVHYISSFQSMIKPTFL